MLTLKVIRVKRVLEMEFDHIIYCNFPIVYLSWFQVSFRVSILIGVAEFERVMLDRRILDS